MKPIQQTNFDGCLQACLASILEIPLDIIPWYNKEEMKGFYDEEGNPILNDGDEGFSIYMDRLNKTFLQNYNINLIQITYLDNTRFPAGYSIGIMTLTEGEHKGFLHAVVVHDGEIVHDPSREPKAFVSENTYYVFIYINPVVKQQTINEEVRV